MPTKDWSEETTEAIRAEALRLRKIADDLWARGLKQMSAEYHAMGRALERLADDRD